MADRGEIARSIRISSASVCACFGPIVQRHDDDGRFFTSGCERVRAAFVQCDVHASADAFHHSL